MEQVTDADEMYSTRVAVMIISDEPRWVKDISPIDYYSKYEIQCENAEANIIKCLLKNGDVFFSKRYDLITVHTPQLNELEMINKKEGFVLYKRWNESWVKYLGQHLATIKN